MEWLFRVMYAQKMRLLSNCWVKCRGGVGGSFILPSLQFRGCHTTMFDFRISCLVTCCVPIAKISFMHKRLHRPSKARVATLVRSLHGCQRQVWWTKGRVFLCCPTFMRGFGVSRGWVNSSYQIWWHHALLQPILYISPCLQWHQLQWHNISTVTFFGCP